MLRLKLTAGLLALLIGTAIAQGSISDRLPAASAERFSFAASDLINGRWYSLFTSIVVVLGPAMPLRHVSHVIYAVGTS
ncbi:MAG: hypothetical protein KDB53_09500 [Planctomycetes bacterium]|nr:hypothetical protein [Planctomycetota bacterium]